MKVVKRVVTTFGDDESAVHVEVTVKVTPEQRAVLEQEDLEEVIRSIVFDELCEEAQVQQFRYYTHPGGPYCSAPSWRVEDGDLVVVSQRSGLDI